MTDSLTDYYRCTGDIPDFSLCGELSEESGFFRFGDSICYGQCVDGSPLNGLEGHLQDVYDRVSSHNKFIQLPFDPAQVLTNLRFERYVARPTTANGFSINGLLRRLYYALRPVLPVSVRRHMQKFHLRGWDSATFPKWPVDTTVESLVESLMSLALQAKDTKTMPFIWFWPEGYSSALIMTHDVETRWGRDFCKSLMDIDEKFDLKASYQIIPEMRYSHPENFLEDIRARGHEINVHDLNHDGQLFQDKEEFVRRAKKINEYAREYQAEGFRSGVMYRNQDWYDAFEFSYDMSVPNVAHLDLQQGGCCTVMPYFVGKILELPVTMTQDYPLFNILRDYSLDLWRRQTELVLQKHGLISFIIHPDYIIKPRARETYLGLLRHLNALRSTGKVWFALPSEVNRWWRERSQMRLVRRGDRWEIEGLGKERARIAYASVSGSSVSYHLGDEKLSAPESCTTIP